MLAFAARISTNEILIRFFKIDTLTHHKVVLGEAKLS